MHRYFQERGRFGDPALTKEEGAEIDTHIVGAGRAQSHGFAKIPLGFFALAEGSVVEGGRAIDACLHPGWHGQESQIEGLARGLVFAQRVAIAGQVVTTIAGRLFQLAGLFERGRGLFPLSAGDSRETQPAPFLSRIGLREDGPRRQEQNWKQACHHRDSIAAAAFGKQRLYDAKRLRSRPTRYRRFPWRLRPEFSSALGAGFVS